MKEFNFNKYTEELVKDYSGKYSDIILLAPKIYSTLHNLLNDQDLDSFTRNHLLVVLGYFIQPRDVISEEIFGAYGLIDDIYLCLFVFRHIKNNNEDLLINNSEIDYDILENHINSTLDIIEEENKEMCDSVVIYTNLKNLR